VDDHAGGDGALRRAHALDAARADLEADGRRVRQKRGADLLGRAAVADRKLGGLDVAVGGGPRDGGDGALAWDGRPALRLGGRHEVDRDARLTATLDLAPELRGIALVARDLERAALGEPERLARLVGKRRELHDRAAGDGGEGGGGADLAGEAGGARRDLRSKPRAIEQHDP